jgi:hypothetical protein
VADADVGDPLPEGCGGAVSFPKRLKILKQGRSAFIAGAVAFLNQAFHLPPCRLTAPGERIDTASACFGGFAFLAFVLSYGGNWVMTR